MTMICVKMIGVSFLSWRFTLMIFYVLAFIMFFIGFLLLIVLLLYIFYILLTPVSSYKTSFFICFSLSYFIFLSVIFLFQVEGW